MRPSTVKTLILLACLMTLCFSFVWLYVEHGDATKLYMRRVYVDVIPPPPVRVVCLVVTHPGNHATKAASVMETWGRRCTYIHFVTTKSETNSTLPFIFSPSKEEYTKLWAKTKFALKFAYDNYLDKVEWIMKADDDTYVIMENLHSFLGGQDWNAPTYFGSKFSVIVNQGYMSGGAGYILSKKSLQLFVENGLTNSTFCSEKEDGIEDVEIGNCLQGVGVKAVATDDSQGRLTFMPLHPESLIHLPADSWLHSYRGGHTKSGLDCCSNLAISFHYVSPQNMRTLEYLIYNIKVSPVKYLLDSQSTLAPDTIITQVVETTAITTTTTTTTTTQSADSPEGATVAGNSTTIEDTTSSVNTTDTSLESTAARAVNTTAEAIATSTGTVDSATVNSTGTETTSMS